MNSNDQRNLNPRQQELIKRLEEIRRQRLEQERKTDKTRPAPARADSSQRRNEQAQQRRKRGTQQQPTRPVNQQDAKTDRRVAAPRRTAPASSQRPVTQQTPRDTAYTQAQRSQAKQRTKTAGSRKKDTKKINSKPLLEQLSNGNSLSQALILSEVLSKPIALRKINS